MPESADESGNQTVALAAESLLEPLLGVHHAPTPAWLADAAATAAGRGLGALYSLLCLPGSQVTVLRVKKPASSGQVRSLARLGQSFNAEIAGMAIDTGTNEVVKQAMESGHAVVVRNIGDVLPLPARGLKKAQRDLGIAEIWLLPLHWSGSSSGLQIVCIGPAASCSPAEAELLGRHAAVALANLRELEAGRKSGDVDAVRWIYDERRFREELDQEARRAKRHERPLSILALRILNLGDLYTRFGRFLTDRVQRQVAAMLDQALRDTDFLGSVGEEGFATILVETDGDGAARAKDRLLEGLQTMKLENTDLPSLKLHLSCASVTLAEDGDDADDLLAALRERMDEQDIVQQEVVAQDAQDSEEDAAAAV